MAVALLDGGETGFDAGEDAVLNGFRLQLPLIPRTTQAVLLHTPFLLDGCPLPFNSLLPLINHLCERFPLLLSFLLGGTYQLDRLINGGSMSLVLIVDLCLGCLNQLLKLGNLEFKKLDRVLSGSLLSLKGSGELERRFKLTGEGFEAMNNVLWDVGPRFRPVVIIVIKFRQGRFGGSWSANLTAGPTAILVFCCGFFILFVYPL